jgi:ABC-type branched-subunit amino acid transport system substrate-binding protein
MKKIIILFCLMEALSLSSLAAEQIKIGAVFSKTGIAAIHNEPLIEMVKLAAEEINNEGGLLGHPVRLIMLDNKSTPIGSKLAAEEAVRLGAAAVIGAHWSSHSLALAPTLQKMGIPMISPGSGKGGRFFRSAWSNSEAYARRGLCPGIYARQRTLNQTGGIHGGESNVSWWGCLG